MSRYGRNQKRAHLAEIERLRKFIQKLKEHMIIDRDLLLQSSRKLEKATQDLKDVFEIVEKVSRYSTAIPAKTIDSDFPDTLYTNYGTIDLHRFKLFVERNRASLSTAVHLIHGKSKERCYMLSDTGFMSYPPRLFAREILEVFQDMICDMQESRGDLPGILSKELVK